MILTPLVIAQLFSIGTGVGSQIAKMTGNNEVAQKLGIASMVSGAVSSAGGALKDAFTAPSTGLKIAGGKLGDLGKSTGMINPKGFGAFEGALPEGISGTFGGKNILPESLGGTFPSPGWDASESIFASPGKEIPFDWSLFR